MSLMQPDQVLEIVRLEQFITGTFGVLRINKMVFCCTLELPERMNASNVSCIPAGQFLCRKINSPSFGTTFQVHDVPGRSEILFHPGNWVRNSRGCILLGASFDKLQGERAITNSDATFNEFMTVMEPHDTASLTIMEVR